MVQYGPSTAKWLFFLPFSCSLMRYGFQIWHHLLTSHAKEILFEFVAYACRGREGGTGSGAGSSKGRGDQQQSGSGAGHYLPEQPESVRRR